MTPPEEVVRRLAGDWLAKAAVDLLVCERLLGQGAAFFETVAFHAQQAAEKSLKALLVARQVEFPKTHDIERLVELVALGDAALAETLADAAELTPFGVEYRYPGEYAPVTAEAANACVSLARKVHDEISKRLSEDVRR
jgi:HEPN domain-containing protein